jgi:hypothetical protein
MAVSTIWEKLLQSKDCPHVSTVTSTVWRYANFLKIGQLMCCHLAPVLKLSIVKQFTQTMYSESVNNSIHTQSNLRMMFLQTFMSFE